MVMVDAPMASQEDHPIFNDDDLDDEDDDNDNDIDIDSEPLIVPADSPSSSSSDDPSAAAVTVAIPSSFAAPLPDPKRPRFPDKKPLDDSRRLFQRLWTDQDEIELLQGFLDYTTGRGTTSSGHHHDTAAFYDQIKSKLQLEFNKNQLVEKLRRLKKKYRNVLSKMSSGKDFVFKTPHDQATFELSRKIWSNLSPNFKGVSEFVDDDDAQNPNPNPNPNNPNPNSVMAAAGMTMTPPRPPNSSYVISHINLNSAATATPMVDQKTGIVVNHSPVHFDVMMSNLNSPVPKLSSRKRPIVGKTEEKLVRNVNLGGSDGNEGIGHVNHTINSNNNNNNNSNSVSNINVGSTMKGLIEETVRSCLSPMVKELVNNAVNGAVLGGGIRGVEALAINAVPLNLSGVSLGSSAEGMDEKWRKQQILELEVYLKRLELVQDQIKLSLEELRSMGS